MNQFHSHHPLLNMPSRFYTINLLLLIRFNKLILRSSRIYRYSAEWEKAALFVDYIFKEQILETLLK